MLTFSPADHCDAIECLDDTFSGTLSLPAGGLWVGVVSGGRCFGEDTSRLVSPGDFFIGRGPFLLHSTALCHVVAVCLTGAAADACPGEFGCRDGRACPRGGDLITLLSAGGHSPFYRSALAYSLLCALQEAQSPHKAVPPLVGEAIDLMREDYATLYGVEEVSEAMGVSKCHLIRVFSAAVGISPGQYLTSVRLAAAKELLLTGEYTLEHIAGLCGFSGANYFCRVFRRTEGCTPTQWRDRQSPARRPRRVPILL